MASTVEGEIDGYTFQWKIVNISQCWWLMEENFIESPTFIADLLQSTKWSLSLSPFTNGQHVSFYLNRDNCSGPDTIEVHCQLAILEKFGSCFKEVTTSKSFERDDSWGCQEFVTSERVFIKERETVLYEDTLMVMCTIWNKEKEPIKLKHLYARTIIETNRRSVLWKIDKLSTQKLALRNKFKDDLVDFDLVFNEKVGFENEIVIIRNSYDACLKYFSLQTFIIDSEGKRKNCGREEFFPNDLKKGILSFMLYLPRKFMENKSLHLQNDILSLYCEFVFGSETVEQDSFGSRMISNELKNVVFENETEHQVGKEKSQNTTILSDDLKSMFNDGIFSDMELRTSTQSFQVHKCILSARSSVFRRMFSTKGTNNGHVDITDLEDDTVHRMLLYLYTDFLEDLRCDSACKLFAAADKYGISSLKCKCSSFLKDNICPSEACNILLLADQHQFHDLKSVVQDYILDHDEVFSTPEWMQFMDTNLKLAADIMYKKINPGKNISI